MSIRNIAGLGWRARARLLIVPIAIAAVVITSWTLSTRETSVEASSPDNAIAAILEGGFALPDADGNLRTHHLGNASIDQQAALADREVTWEEYEAATWAAANCMQDAGLELRSTPTPDASGKMLVYGVALNGDAQLDRQMGEASRECMVHHSLFTDLVWQIQLSPSEQTLEAARDALGECLLESGVPESMIDRQRLTSAIAHAPGRTYIDCANEVQRDFGIPNFGG